MLPCLWENMVCKSKSSLATGIIFRLSQRKKGRNAVLQPGKNFGFSQRKVTKKISLYKKKKIGNGM
jgi:hypothetical protein